MKTTKEKDLKVQVNGEKENAEKAPCSGCDSLSPQLKKQEMSKNLSTDIANHLLYLMKKVTEEDVTPQTVHSACDCAQQMYNLMKLNLEVKKMGY